jgi:hypothetical protein
MIKLTRPQELMLIEIGAKALMDMIAEREQARIRKQNSRNSDSSSSSSKSKKSSYNKKQKWTDAQRKKFSITMKKKWAKIKAMKNQPTNESIQ